MLFLLACTGPDTGSTDKPVDTADTSDTPVNAPPGAPVVTITAAEDGTLTCAGISTDAENDPLTYAFAWVAGSITLTTDVVTPDVAVRESEWTCTVIANDGMSDSAPGTASWTATGPVPGEYAFQPVMDVQFGSDMSVLPDGRLLVTTIIGDLVLLDPVAGAELGRVTVADWSDELLSLTVDPRFGDGTHDKAYTWTSQTCKLTQYDVTLDPFTVTNPLVVMDQPCAVNGGHSSGDLIFWSRETADPALYLAVGPFTDIEPQKDDDQAEGIIAVYIDPATGLPTPALPGSFTEPAAVAIGLRNPWRLIDCGAVLCTAEPGHNDIEEINLYAGPGQNFGAGEVEGPDSTHTYVDPVRYWEHHDPAFVEEDADGSGELRFVKVPMLGVRASGLGYGGRLEGVVLYGEFYDGWVRGLSIADDGTPGDDVPIANGRHIMAMAETPDGTIYALSFEGHLSKLIYRGDRPTVGNVGDPLSATTFADGGISFDVRFPLWSNGADKDRMIQVPTGTKIDVSQPNHWVYPVGTKIWKTFSMDRVRIETRLLTKTDDGWVAGVYLYDGDEAYLTDGRRQELHLTNGMYTVPSQATCAFCHAADGDDEWPIGPEPFQLGDPGLGRFRPIMEGGVPEVPTVTGDDFRGIRGVLHGNCAFCHSPGALASMISEVQLDFRYDADGLTAINERVNYYDGLTPYGPPTEYLIIPGDTDSSVMLDILENTDMPPAAVWRPDNDLIDGLTAWIDGMPVE